MVRDLELEVDLEVSNTSSLDRAIKRVIYAKLKDLKLAFVNILKTEFVPDYMSLFSSTYDSLMSGLGPFDPEDPTSPQYMKPFVYEYVRQSLEDSLSTVDADSFALWIKAIPTDVWARRPSRKEMDMLKIFYFYLSGVPGKWVFITEEIFRLVKREDENREKLGRFGKGYLMHYNRYKARYDAFKKVNPKIDLKSPDELISPFSGMPPIRLFEYINMQIRPWFVKYLEKARKSVH